MKFIVMGQRNGSMWIGIGSEIQFELQFMFWPDCIKASNVSLATIVLLCPDPFCLGSCRVVISVHTLDGLYANDVPLTKVAFIYCYA